MTDHDTDLPYTAAGTHVHVHHPETGAWWESPIGYLPIARARGWEPAIPPALVDLGDGVPVVPRVAAPVTPVAEQTGFDPAHHDVEAVNAYLDEMTAGGVLGEIARVFAVESDGKARKGVLEGRHAAPDPDPDAAEPSAPIAPPAIDPTVPAVPA